MMHHHSSDTVKSFITAINDGELEVALNLYAPDARIMTDSGELYSGKDAIQDVLKGFISLQPKMTIKAEKMINEGDTAIHCFQWTSDFCANGMKIQGTGIFSGVLRRQTDGNWRIVLESPWGAAIKQ